MHVYIYIYIYIYMHIYAYMHIDMLTYTYIHLYTCMHTELQNPYTVKGTAFIAYFGIQKHACICIQIFSGLIYILAP